MKLKDANPRKGMNTVDEISRSKYILNLAKELLDEIELNRTKAENLILKALHCHFFMTNSPTY